MRRREQSHKTRNGIIAIFLFCLAGAGGYYTSSYLHARTEQNVADNQQTIVDKPQPDSEACIASLSATTKFSQKLMFAVYADQAAAIAPILADADVGGIIIMDEVSAKQIAQLRGLFKITPFIAVDQEGGTVQRYKAQGILPGAATIANGTPEEAYAMYLKDSKYLSSIGITTNFAPVVDVESRTPSPLPGRMYSSSPATVTAYASKAVEAMEEAGIRPVIKHFPGLGSASGNTDFVSATTDPYSVLENRDLVPYQNLVKYKPDVMVGNMIVPGLTDAQPAIWSPEAIALLREIGYENAVIYSDSLTAKAIPGTIQEAAMKAWGAGIDVAVIVQNREDMPAIKGYIDSIIASGKDLLNDGAINATALDESFTRILARKAIDPCSISQAQ